MRKHRHQSVSSKWGNLLNLVLSFCLVGTTAYNHYNKHFLSDIEKLLEDIQNKGVASWQMHMNIDPYENGTILRTSPEERQQLTLHADGTYEKQNLSTKTEGNWKIDPETMTITFYCKKADGKQVGKKPVPSQFQIISYTDNTLKLGWQGRHGIVEQVFQPVGEREEGRYFIMV